MSESEQREVTPKDADIVVKQEKNQMYNPVVSTEEVAQELEVSTEEAFELLKEATRPDRKEVGDTHIWW